MTCPLHRRQLLPVFALLFLAASASVLLSAGMTPGPALTAGSLLGLTGAAAVWGLTEPDADLAHRLRWLLWPQIAAVVTITWLAYLNLIPRAFVAFPYSDKVFHFTLFGAVTFFAELWLRDRRVAKILPVSIALPASMAAIEEGLQHLSPHRTMDITDLLCDLAGMSVAWLLARALTAWAARSSGRGA